MTRTGRPREFDADLALERALELFWRHGYEGASVNAIADAMGVSKSSLYATFGDKEALYLRALARYGERQQAMHAALLDAEPDARRAVEQLMMSAVEHLSVPGHPGACMVVTGTTACASPGVPESVKAALHDALRSGARAIEARLARAQRDAQLGPEVDIRALAIFFHTTIAGLNVQARGHQCTDVLRSVVSTTMQAWPAPPPQTPRPARSGRQP